MQTLAEIRAMLDERGLRPKKSLGQNFLVDHNLLQKLVDESGADDGDVILEVGPGTGTLTETLLERGCSVVAVELDDALAELLRDRLMDRYEGRFTLIHADCLESKRAVNPAVVAALDAQRGDKPFRLVANLPYHAGTPLMLTLLCRHPACVSMAVTIQREVADRLLAGPGSKTYGTLGVVAQATARSRRVATLGPGCFWPQPGVDSAMVVVERGAALTDDLAGFAEFVQKIFAGRRKQLGAHFRQLGWSPDGGWPEGVSPTDRAEDLGVERLVAVYETVRASGAGGVGREPGRV